MYCVIQPIDLKKENTNGQYKELEAYKTEWAINGVEECKYYYRYAGGRFERPIKKAYKISIHHSFRENGRVKKKQWCICTMSYYDIADGSTWIKDYIMDNKWNQLLEDMGLTEEDLCNIVYSKLDPLKEKIKGEYQLTEEYKIYEKHKEIINKYWENKREFEDKYGKDTYDYYYDVFGVLREKKKFELLKSQYEEQKEYQRSYHENFESNYNSNYDFSSYFNTKQSNYTEEQKQYLKKIYRAAAAKLHPDIAKDDGSGMKFLNQLKEGWGI